MVADSRSSPDRVALPVRDNNRTAMEVQVVDKAGTPLRGVTVTEHWSHSSLEHNGHEAEATTDEGGYVTFPVRTIRAALLGRVIGPMQNVGEGHPAAYLLVFGDYSTVSDEPYYVPGRPLAAQIVVGPPRASP